MPAHHLLHEAACHERTTRRFRLCAQGCHQFHGQALEKPIYAIKSVVGAETIHPQNVHDMRLDAKQLFAVRGATKCDGEHTKEALSIG